jgi:hypothetical protein
MAYKKQQFAQFPPIVNDLNYPKNWLLPFYVKRWKIRGNNFSDQIFIYFLVAVGLENDIPELHAYHFPVRLITWGSEVPLLFSHELK